MYRTIISAIVGAVILFAFQAGSWMSLGIHKDSFKYTPAQDSILAMLSDNLEDGYYYLPYFDHATTTPEQQKEIKKMSSGKPWAMIQYHAKMEMSMPRTMGFGFLVDFLICLIISLVLVNVQVKGFGARMFLVLALAALVALGGPFYQANWFSTPDHYVTGELIDIIAGYGLAGLWMAWWTNRKLRG